ncbi:hypothetical protein [Streptomyces sp. NPDC020362]|uniref:hypothetical protein n=1 Tax=unclassified Streptomyces TaxID=2593676 RepID=UPI0033D0E3F6
MGTSLGRGGVAGCLWNGCLAVLVLALVMVCGLWVWLWLTPRRWEGEARDDMEKHVAEARSQLADSAADGSLLGTEIERDVHTGPMSGPVAVRRQGGTVTVTALLAGFGPGFMNQTLTTGCYRFRVVPPRVTAATRVPGSACGGRTRAAYRPSAEVADDVVTEVRAALAHGGLDAADRAEVWQTRGIDVVRKELSKGRLTVTVRLLTGLGGYTADCYTFDVRQDPPSVTARKQAPGRCGSAGGPGGAAGASGHADPAPRHHTGRPDPTAPHRTAPGGP